MNIYIPVAALILLTVSCATRTDDWRLPDPNSSANIAAELTDPQYFSNTHPAGERRAMTQEELLNLVKPKDENKPQFSGWMSVGVSSSF